MKDIKVILLDDLTGTGWVELPNSYVPPVFSAGSKIFLRRTVFSWEVRIICKGVSNGNSPVPSIAPKLLPPLWQPEYDIQIILHDDVTSLGRIRISPSGQIAYTGRILSGSTEPTGYVFARTDKAYPTENPT